MTAHVAPIPTRYKGYRFRSRLEARWAVLFDAMDMRWEYEADGFTLPSGPYLPDFWLPEIGVWCEVKPNDDAVVWSKIYELAEHTTQPVAVLWGTPEAQWYPAIVPPWQEIVDGKEIEWPATEDWIELGASAATKCAWLAGGELGFSRYSLCSPPFWDQAVRAARGARFEHGESGAERGWR